MNNLEQLQAEVSALRSLEAKQRAITIARLNERYSVGSLGLTMRRDPITGQWANASFTLPNDLIQNFVTAEKELHEHLVAELKKAEGTLEAINALLERKEGKC